MIRPRMNWWVYFHTYRFFRYTILPLCLLAVVIGVIYSHFLYPGSEVLTKWPKSRFLATPGEEQVVLIHEVQKSIKSIKTKISAVLPTLPACIWESCRNNNETLQEILVELTLINETLTAIPGERRNTDE